MTRTVIVPEASIRRSGVQLRRLALLGQLVVFAAILFAPVVLYQIRHAADPGLGFLAFLKESIALPGIGPANLYQLARALALLAALECVRRFGKTLAHGQLDGKSIAPMLDWLKWLVLLLALLCGIGIEFAPTDSAACRSCLRLDWDFSIVPLYIGLLLAVGLSIFRKVIERMRLLQTENEGFV
jgi:hypothetical protein